MTLCHAASSLAAAPIPVLQSTSYATFLAGKWQLAGDFGFKPLWIPDWLFDFQKFLVEWNIRKGRSETMADCGLGKTPMQLVWAQNVVQHTNKPVLVMTPLAVAAQTLGEAEKFGIEAAVSRDGSLTSKIVITNYERLHHFNPADFVGAVCDESQCLKAFDGKRRKFVTRFMAKMQYRLLCTATPSPNDFIELGTQAEALGVMTQSDMLGYFFVAKNSMRHSALKEDDFWNTLQWYFKPHAEKAFWRWVGSWARACAKPEDLGFDGSRFKLPPLNYRHHVIDVPFIPPGELYPRPAVSLHEARLERHRTLQQRCEKVASLVNHGRQVIVWCHWNDEGDTLTDMIPGAVQVAGGDRDEDKESRLLDFARGNFRVLVTKPKIGCWGLNLQKCGDMTFFPSFSFEQFYQGVRRCWRFGREGEVNVEIVSSTGEAGVMARLQAKQANYEHMFQQLVRCMGDELVMTSHDNHNSPVQAPAWQ